MVDRIYAAWAIELEDVQGRTVLLTLRRREGKEAVEGDLLDQVADVANEAGVRSVVSLPPCPNCDGPNGWEALSGGDSREDPSPNE